MNQDLPKNGQTVTISSNSSKLHGKRAKVLGHVTWHPDMAEFQARIQGNNLTGSAVEVILEGQTESVLIDEGEMPWLSL